jgi:hypothetical protein
MKLLVVAAANVVCFDSFRRCFKLQQSAACRDSGTITHYTRRPLLRQAPARVVHVAFKSLSAVVCTVALAKKLIAVHYCDA